MLDYITNLALFVHFYKFLLYDKKKQIHQFIEVTMKKLFFIPIIVLLLFGCDSHNDSSENAEKYVTKQSNKYVAIQFQEIERTRENNEEGFWLHFLIEHVKGEKLTKQNFSFALSNEIEIDGQIFTAKDSETEFAENKAYYKQYFTPLIDWNIDEIPVTFYIKPLYYKKEITFENLTNGSQNIEKNELQLVDVEVEGNKLHLIIHDAHPVVGLQSTLLIDNEEIYPTTVNTELNKQNNTLYVTYTFASPIPEKFTMKFTRHQLEDIVWKAPFLLPGK